MIARATMEDLKVSEVADIANNQDQTEAKRAARHAALHSLLDLGAGAVWVTLKDRSRLLKVPKGVTQRQIRAKLFGCTVPGEDAIATVRTVAVRACAVVHAPRRLQDPAVFSDRASGVTTVLVAPDLLAAEVVAATQNPLDVYFYTSWDEVPFWATSTSDVWVWSATPKAASRRALQNAMSVPRTAWMALVARAFQAVGRPLISRRKKMRP
jgi:hypothetical protein